MSRKVESMYEFESYVSDVEERISAREDLTDKEVREEARRIAEQYRFLFEEEPPIKEIEGVKMKQSVEVYTKEKCDACKLVMKRLNHLGVDYVIKHLEEKEHLDKVKALGAKQAPVVIYKDTWHCGFSFDRLNWIARDQREDTL